MRARAVAALSPVCVSLKHSRGRRPLLSNTNHTILSFVTFYYNAQARAATYARNATARAHAAVAPRAQHDDQHADA